MLDKIGYLHFKNYFNPDKISIEADKTVKTSQKIKWNYIKVYHNIFIYKFINIFSINFPFNNKLNPNFYNEFLKINLNDLILRSTNWKNLKISQIELQHNEKYNYQSSWHRDAKIANLENIVAIIYLRDENGFRLVPKNLESEMIENSPFSKEKNYKHGYTKLPKKYYHQFDAKAGDVVIFDAGLLHQGSCKGKRTHLFARCVENTNSNTIEDNLKPDALLDNIELESASYNWDFNQNYCLFNKRVKSLFNLILYYLPILKIIKYIIDIKKKKIHFHYSIFQK
ncbi:hypothetical protein N9O17_03210 [Candidatus Pelagibacter sp.]|nr:hypothetical protein [Candidatus Pelagibacter sp.]